MPKVTTIPYPMVDGARVAFVSMEAKLKGQIFVGITKLDYSRKRNREILKGTNADPIGKTRGDNDYACTGELYLAEFNQFIHQVLGGDGYGDVFFPIDVTYSENGFDTIHDQIIGCTVDETKRANAKGPAGTTTEVDFAPLKIKFDGLDDNGNPLQGVPQ